VPSRNFPIVKPFGYHSFILYFVRSKSELVKSKIPAPVLLLITLSIISCTKESLPNATDDIVGKWKNTAVYSDPAQGGHGWEAVTRFHEYATFNADAKFSFVTDVPASTGTYSFNGSSKDLLLRFEADQSGNTSRSETRKVEVMTEDKLILSFTSPDGMIYKTEYSRIN
jgi:hypothetical protein